MKKLIIFLVLFYNAITAQSYYKLVQDDDTKFMVSYDTAIDGKITVKYIPSDSYLSTITEELISVEDEISRMDKIIFIYNRRLETLNGKRNKLLVLKNSQEK